MCVLRGEDDRITGKIKAALDHGLTPEFLLNNVLIPAIAEVGEKYEKKEFFLNHLTAGAEAMSKRTAFLEPLLLKKDGCKEKKTRIILATVRKDIHDIGKNIVGLVLKNYGFDVIDLGKDVPPEVIIDRAVAENAGLIGLSALMTTTMKYMRETVELARKRQLDHLHFIVGGAVVDNEFAQEIGAVYASDPMATVAAAKKLSGK